MPNSSDSARMPSGPVPFSDPGERSISELQAGMAQGRWTAVQLVHAYRGRIRAYDQRGPALNAISALNPWALAEARARDAERRRGRLRGPLHGIPVLIKENIEVRGMATTAGTLALAQAVARRDAAVVRALRAAGAVILGKTTMHELAAGISNVSSLSGPSRNPYAPRRNPGGSSGGSGAAVAASFAAAALGTDTSGSIRIPAAFQNLVGLRMTHGLAPMDGIVPLSPSQDVVGPLARSVADLALMLDACLGPVVDQAEGRRGDGEGPAAGGAAGAAHRPAPGYAAALRRDRLPDLRIGVLRSLFGDDAHELAVSSTVRAGLRAMARHGAELVDVDVPGLEDRVQLGNAIALEFNPALADYLAREHPGVPASLNDILASRMHHHELDRVFSVRSRSQAPDPAALRQIMQARARLRERIVACMEAAGVHVLAYPTVRCRPAIVGEPQGGSNSQLSASLGWPAISIPAGFTRDGVPVGMDLLGPAHSEQLLLDVAASWEAAAAPRQAPLHTPPLGSAAATPIQGRLVLGVAGLVPGEVAVRYRIDVPRGVLRFRVGLPAALRRRVQAITLQAWDDGQLGPVLHHLWRPGQAGGTVDWHPDPAGLRAVLQGNIRLCVYAAGLPDGRAVTPLPGHAAPGGDAPGSGPA